MNHNHHLCLGFHLRNNNHNLRQHHRQLCHQSQACNHPHHDVEAEHDVQVKPLVQWEKLDMSSLERRKLCCSVTFHAVSFSRHSFPLSSIFSQYFFSPLSLTFHRPGRHHLCCLVALCFNRQVRRGSPKYEYRISSIEYQVSSIEYRVLRIDYWVLSPNYWKFCRLLWHTLVMVWTSTISANVYCFWIHRWPRETNCVSYNDVLGHRCREYYYINKVFVFYYRTSQQQ